MATLPNSASFRSPAVPFLFSRPQAANAKAGFRSALAAAVAGERGDFDSRRNTRGRIAYLLCELGVQLARRKMDRDGELPLSRADIAELLGVGLPRVKRTLALLSLSQVISTDGQRLRVLDWHRLCGVACFQRTRLKLATEDFDAEATLISQADRPPPNPFTASGDPACFV